MKRIFNFNANENNLRIAVFTDKIIRITYGKDTDVTSRNMVITADFDALPAVPVTESETEREYSISTGAVKVNIDKKTLDLRFERADGSLLSGLYGHSLKEYEVYSTVG